MSAAAWPIREVFNQKHRGNIDYRYLVAGAAGFLLVMLAASWQPASARTDVSAVATQVSDAEVHGIVQKHCTACHAKKPTHEGFDVAPLDVVLESLDDLRQNSARVHQQTIATDIMPLANETGMTAEEREALEHWLASQK